MGCKGRMCEEFDLAPAGNAVTRRSVHQSWGPVRTLDEVAGLLYRDGLTDRILPKNHVAMIEKRALAKLRRNDGLRELVRQMFPWAEYSRQKAEG